MYNILVFDNDTVSYNLVYMSSDLNAVLSMYKYYLSIFKDNYIIVNQTIQTNESLII